jgi:hypothetical protein
MTGLGTSEVDRCSLSSCFCQEKLRGCLPSRREWLLAARFHRSVAKMERGLPPNKLVPALRESVDELR